MSFINLIDIKYPKLSQAVFHIPNGGKRNIAEAVRFKKMGVRAGVWDVCCNLPHPVFNGLWIEFKSKGGRVTKEQESFLINVIKHNCQDWSICQTLSEAMEVFETYIAGGETTAYKPTYLLGKL